ncbi:MAG: type II secretion system secretin GspD [Candidatus Sulfobium sp.]
MRIRYPFLACILTVVTVLCQTVKVDNSFAEARKTKKVENAVAEAKKSNAVTFNFVDVDLPVVTKFISDITGKNFIFDDKVKGKITIIAPTKLSIDQAYNLFTAVLEIKGFTVVPSGVDAYKIIPSIEAKQQGLQIATAASPVNASYIARVITFKYIPADDALKFLQPLVSRDGLISTFGPGNLLLVVDSGLNVEKIVSLSQLIDKPSTADKPEMVILKNASADAVAKIINEGISKKGRRIVPARPSNSPEAKAVADTRLNAVILFGDKAEREAMKELIGLIDVPAPEAQGRINVYFLENADAEDLAKVLQGMIRGTEAQPARRGAGGAPVTPFEAPGGITVTPDKATNSLVIVASPADYQNISEILKKLDRRRKQVYVEAMIVEASMDKLRSLGSQWRAAATKGGKPIAIGGFGTIDQTAFQNILQGLEGASVGGLGNFLNVPLTSVNSDGTVSTNTLTVPGFAALFSLNEFRDTVNVLSTPQILTSDNKEAEILVGENVPFITQSQTTSALGVTSSGGAVAGVVNSIQRQDVGIILKITPHITAGDHVKLDIYEEISSVKNQSDALTATVGPTITKRSTKTTVVVRDDQTVVIGGLMSTNDEETVTKMPILGDIPILGWLFKRKNITKNKTNLIVFLSPHVVQGPEKLAKITMEKQKEFAAANQQFAEGELIVKFKKGVPKDRAQTIISGQGDSVLRYLENLDTYQIKLKEGKSVEKAVEDYRAMPEVENAEPNYVMKMMR